MSNSSAYNTVLRVPGALPGDRRGLRERPSRAPGHLQIRRCYRRSTRPGIEALEARAVPTTFTVLNLADGGSGSLRAAIEVANSHPGADVITFARGLKGTVTLTGGELSITDDLRLAGPGPGRLAVSGNDASRVFRIGNGASVTIEDLTITRGRAGQGGGIFSEAGTELTLKDCTVTYNRATLSQIDLGGGGGVFVAGVATINGCTFRANSATGSEYAYGGGLQVSGGTLRVTNSHFSDNVAEGSAFGSGGALDSEFSTVSIVGSTFTNNRARGLGPGAPAFGGALASYDDEGNDRSFTLSGCVLVGNQALGGAGGDGLSYETAGGGKGGAFQPTNTTVVMADCVLLGNEAVTGALAPGAAVDLSLAGGGGFVGFGGSLDATNCLIVGNRALGGAGAVAYGGGLAMAYGGVLTAADCIFLGNVALGGAGGSGTAGGDAWGGGLDVSVGSTATLSGCAFLGNAAVGGAGGAGAAGGRGIGGAILIGDDVLFGFPDDSALAMNGCLLANNEARGGRGGIGGDGGDAWGGGLAVIGGAAEVAGCTIRDNQAAGGDGRRGGSGGDGLGGGLFVNRDATLIVRRGAVTKNQANGGGPGGRGIGGGVYNLGLFIVDAGTSIRKNRASTSHDEVFGRG